MTLLLLWQEYRAEHADGYGYSRFCDLYREWRGTISPTMRDTHGAPRSCLSILLAIRCRFDATTGMDGFAHIFVAVLGASNYTYAEARWSEGLADWIRAHVYAFNMIGGVPKAVVCDNLTGVTATCRYEPGINRTYQELAGHYDTAILTARPRKPRDKAKVEVAVQIVQRFVLARLRIGASSRSIGGSILSAELFFCRMVSAAAGVAAALVARDRLWRASGFG